MAFSPILRQTLMSLRLQFEPLTWTIGQSPTIGGLQREEARQYHSGAGSFPPFIRDFENQKRFDKANKKNNEQGENND